MAQRIDVTDETVRSMVRDFLAGEEPIKRVLAPRYGVSERVFYRCISESGISTKRPEQARGRYSRGDIQRWRTLYEGGMSLTAIATMAGCEVQNVRTRLLKIGTVMRPAGQPAKAFTSEQVDEMARLWESNVSQERIALQFATSQGRVSSLLRTALPQTYSQRRERHPNWKGGRSKAPGGYWKVLVEPSDLYASMASQTHYVLEHRLVMAQALGRPLTRSETVHHINGDGSDNRLGNLQLRSGQHGKGMVFVCGKCGSHDIVPVPLP